MTIMTATILASTGRFGMPLGGNRPSSKARCVSSGGTTASAAVMSTSEAVRISAMRCGANSAMMRRPRCGMRGASAFAAFCARMSTGP